MNCFSLSLLFVFVAGCVTPRVPIVDSVLVSKLETAIPELLNTHQVSGLSMMLIRDGHEVWCGTFGRRRSDQEATLTQKTVFEAASMSKPLFAYAVLKLVEDGKLDLDRPLDAYLPSPYLPDQPEAAKITARMVLAHISGLPNWRRGKQLVLKHPPGTRFNYSGEGFVYLQRVVEHITGQDLAVFMTERLLTPLGMRRSSYVWEDAFDDDFAGGHDKSGAFIRNRRMFTKPNAAFTLYTTPHDYGLFLIEMLRPNQAKRHTLATEMHEAMLTLQPVPNITQARERRGLGWVLGSPETGDWVSHSGSNGTGFRCHSRFNVGRGDGLVIMTNGVNGRAAWKAVVQICDEHAQS